ncbi:fatty acid desaturase family protein [Tundrisphaera lichenicola]|uniref:fatty acid desaturase family protein n=1 Tax=Tundrisphaera lichenicola TaxID=2029860 RepID=UPI003EBE678A
MPAMPAEADLSWDEAHRQVVGLMRVDNRANIPYILREYLGLAFTLAACSWAYRAWASGQVPTAGFLPMAALGVFAVAAFQHRLSGLAHDASHGTLFRDKLLNELASDLLLMFPLVAMTQKYREAHLGHHRYVNDPERDPDILRLNHPDPHHFPISRAGFWSRYVVQGLWPPSILRYLIGRARAANLGTTGSGPSIRGVYRSRVARSLRGAYWLSALSVIQVTGSWPIFWLFWVVPLLTAYPLYMQLREIAHHSNAPDDGDLTNSRVFRVHPLLGAVVFPYGQAFHLTHHLFAMVPHHRIAQAHAILTRHPPYREGVIVCQGFFFRRWGTEGPSLLELLASDAVGSPNRTLPGPHVPIVREVSREG